MSCTVTLYNLLGQPKQTGGVWTLQAATGGQASLSINGAPSTVITVTNNVGNDNVVVGFNNTAAGSYTFRYTVGNSETGGSACQDTADVVVTVVAGAKAGNSRQLSFCSADLNDYNLFQFLENRNGLGALSPNLQLVPVDTDGVWSGNGVGQNGHIPNALAPTDDVFRPSAVVIPSNTNSVTRRFTYSVIRQNGSTNCANCSDTADLDLTVFRNPNAGLDASITVCNAL